MDEVREVYEYEEWWQRGRDKQQKVITNLIKNYQTTQEGLAIVQEILDLIHESNLPKSKRSK
jgi:hypothetical protein